MQFKPDVTLFWFRRDLRLTDNHGLYRALKDSGEVLPVFIFDTEILDKLEKPLDARVEFIFREVERLRKALKEKGSTLLVLHGKPLDVFRDLAGKYNIRSLYLNSDYEPYARQRDKEVSDWFSARGIAVHAFRDQVIFDPEEVVKEDGTPYTVFTPYMRKWKDRLASRPVEIYNCGKWSHMYCRHEPARSPALEDLGFRETGMEFPDRDPAESLIREYHRFRDYPAERGTSRLSLHLRFGTVSTREWVTRARAWNEKFLDELIWREFYKMILWHFPRVTDQAFKPEYDRIPWRNNEEEFMAWQQGMTGYPLVDAGMRELLATGFMHNRVRMVTASFLVKHLLIDWRWGEAWFAGKLLDFELSSNNGGWQWAAGSGCDAAPYFRVFNPLLQQQKFDPAEDYVRKWIPELHTGAYPAPLVDHREARERAIRVYKQALSER